MIFEDVFHQAQTEIDRAKEHARRANARELVHARLRRGKATSSQLSRICLRFGARIKELREEHGAAYIVGRPLGNGEWEYRLGK